MTTIVRAVSAAAGLAPPPASTAPGWALIASDLHEPQIVLASLTRLRWVAVFGQLLASGIALWGLHFQIPQLRVAAVIAVTALSNAVLVLVPRLMRPPNWLVPAVLLLDVLLLTALLYLTGGPANPFAMLYLVHVAMGVIVLEAIWTWTLVAAVGACFAVICFIHIPLREQNALAQWVMPTGSWLALVLVCALTASFIGRVRRALRLRETELAAMGDRAMRNERLAALTTLAAGAAHELSTPLGTIAVVAKELERDGSPIEAIHDDARLIRLEVDRCRHILSRMRLDACDDIAQQPLNIGDLVERLRKNISEAEQRRLNVQYDASTANACPGSVAIEQALLVLVRNAFDACDATQSVTLNISAVGRLRFEVIDAGCGMSPELLRRVGEPFFTTKEPGKGMGLGLYLVHLIADRCAATFTIESAPGVGTRCVLEL